MAIATKHTGRIVQAWISPTLSRKVKAQAELERRSVSSLVRIAIEDRLRADPESRR